MTEKLNLVVICLDTMRYDMIRRLGVDWIRTPNMDRLASQSVVFENCFAEGLPTLRGWHRIPPQQTTMAELLQHAGYTSALIGDTPHMNRAGNFHRGFTCYDWIRGQESDSFNTGPADAADLSKHVKSGAKNTQRLRMLFQYLLNIKDRRTEDDYFCAQVFDKSARWLEENVDNQPLFLWADSFDPHEPWDPPTRFADLYCPGYEGPELILAGVDDGLTPKEKERVKALYCGEVTFVDERLGRLLDTIERLSLRDNTIVMLVTDHGTELYEHGGLHKSGQRLFPYLTRQAWLVRHPRLGFKERRVKPFVQTEDVFPTTLGLLGVSHGPVDGVDVWSLATGERAVVRDHVITGFQSFASVRDEEWNFCINFEKPGARGQLYHHASDTSEQKDVAGDCPDVVDKQRKRLEALLGQPLPAKLPDRTVPTEAPYHKHFEKLLKAGKIALP